MQTSGASRWKQLVSGRKQLVRWCEKLVSRCKHLVRCGPERRTQSSRIAGRDAGRELTSREIERREMKG